MAAYNTRRRPTIKAQSAIRRMTRENMVLYPLMEPQPVIRPPFSQATVNRRAESMRQPSPYSYNYQEPMREEHTLSRQQLRRKAMQSRRKGNRKSPSRRPHRRVPYEYNPPSPQYKPPTSSEEEDRENPKEIPREKQLVRIPQGDSSDEEVPELVPDYQEEYQTPPERTASPPNLARQHAEIKKQLDKALEEALNQNPLPSTSGSRQGGGDRETTPPGTATAPRAPLNMAEDNWYLEPNKVQFMDGPDTFRANVGRHRVPPLRLLRAKTFPHLVFADPPASPDGKENAQEQRKERAATSPQRQPRGQGSSSNSSSSSNNNSSSSSSNNQRGKSQWLHQTPLPPQWTWSLVWSLMSHPLWPWSLL